jgi:hypothetical protein
MYGVAAPASCYLCYWAGFPETFGCVYHGPGAYVCVYRVVAVVPSASVCQCMLYQGSFDFGLLAGQQCCV